MKNSSWVSRGFLALSLGIAATAGADTTRTVRTGNADRAAETGDASGYGKTRGVMGPITAGPVITALGAPSPFRAGAEAKFLDIAAVSFDYGFLPKLSFSDVGVKYSSWRVTGRFHPFRGAFYVGAALGNQSFTGTLTRTTLGTAVTYQIDVAATLIVPQVGWRWQWESGFFMGMELGAQIPVSPTATFTSDAPAVVQATPEYQRNKKDIEDEGKTYGQTVLPHVALLQAGFLF